MIKVLNIISDSNFGGAGRVLLYYLKYRDKSAFDVSVALPDSAALAPMLEELGITVYTPGITPEKSYDRKDVRALARLIREISPDIVHTHGSLSGRIAGKKCGKTVIYTRHSAFPPGRVSLSAPGRLLNSIIARRYSDRIIAVGPAARENLTDVGIPARMIDAFMNGAEQVRQISSDERARLRESFGIAPDDFTLGILARLEHYKGHLHILEAADILKKEGRRFKLIIAGEGTFEQEIKSHIHDLGLDNEVILAGFVSDVAPILGILDLQLNASYGTETSSLSLIEGMSIGLPAVVSDYGGNPHVIFERENGLIYKTGDAPMLARRIAELMDDPALQDTLRGGALKIYSEKFTCGGFAANIENTYYKTLEGKSNGR